MALNDAVQNKQVPVEIRNPIFFDEVAIAFLDVEKDGSAAKLYKTKAAGC